MKKVGILCILILVTFVLGCKKDKTAENTFSSSECSNIEEPGDYFPAYPNSWWKFINQNNDTILYSISSSYEECNGMCRPIFLNLQKCISDMGIVHNFYAGQGVNATVTSPIYSLTIDSTLTCPISFATFQEQTAFISQDDVRFIRMTTNLDTILVVNGNSYADVIEVYEYDKLNAEHRYFDYFAKDIGLIKRDSLNATDTTDHIQILGLENYFIGN